MAPIHSDNWTAPQLRFQRWLALPKAARSPRTQKALAEKIGVCEDTLTDWKHLPGFRDAVGALAREYVKDDIPDILYAIRRDAKKGSVAHINMALAMCGMAGDIAAAGKGPQAAPVVREIVVHLAEAADAP